MGGGGGGWEGRLGGGGDSRTRTEETAPVAGGTWGTAARVFLPPAGPRGPPVACACATASSSPAPTSSCTVHPLNPRGARVPQPPPLLIGSRTVRHLAQLHGLARHR